MLGTGGSNARRSASPVARAQRRLVRAVRASGAVPPGPRVPARPRGISRSSRSPPLPRVTCVHLRLPAGEWRSLRPWRRPRPGSRVLPPASLEPHRPASRAGSALCACPLGSACGVLGTRGARRDRSPAATGQSSGPIGSPRAKAHLARAYTRSACLVRRWCARVARGARQSTSRFCSGEPRVLLDAGCGHVSEFTVLSISEPCDRPAGAIPHALPYPVGACAPGNGKGCQRGPRGVQ